MLDDVIKELQAGIEKSIEALRRDLARVRTGRANAAMLDGIRADYYGVPTLINQMASVNIVDARMIVVRPWEKNQLKAIEKALRESDLNINPQVDGEVIRLPIPPLTEERRKEFVKLAKKTGEEAKVAIRKHRREAMEMCDTLDKDGEVSKDDADRTKKKVEEIVADAISQADKFISAKEKDILDV